MIPPATPAQLRPYHSRLKRCNLLVTNLSMSNVVMDASAILAFLNQESGS
ncbi:MAG: hypothetical protein ACRC8Y_11815 [Chroococcales cyanobacterium]